MAWNEPGGNDNDPWGNRKNTNGGGPPDLDEVFKNVKGKLDGMFGQQGRGSNNGGGRSGGGLPGGGLSRTAGMLIAGVVFALWLFSGIYVIEPAQSGVVTQFGRHVATTGPGINWRFPWPFQQVDKVDVEQIQASKLSRQLMLTQDENIVSINLSVQYNIKSAEDYLFNVRDPDLTLEQVLESAVREVIGQTDMESVLTTEPESDVTDADADDAEPATERAVIDSDAVGSGTQETLQQILDTYESGINVLSVNIEQVQPPDEVQAAFSDAIKAREDRERIINEAQAYRNDLLPRARGDAQRILEESEAYKTRVEQSAIGESQRFLSLLLEFEKAPDVTRERLYIEAMESVLSNTSKVLVDSSQGGNSLMYLPIDKLIDQNRSTSGQARSSFGNELPLNSNSSDAPRFNDLPIEVQSQTRELVRSRERGTLR